MFKESNHSTTEAIIDLIRTLPEREQKTIVRSISSSKQAKKKLSRKAKNKQRVLNDIREGLREVQEAKRTGKELPDFQELLHELKRTHPVH